jgi:Ca2+-transporting ATPase
MTKRRFYHKTVPETLEELKTHKGGLSEKEAEQRLMQHGPNLLKKEKQISPAVLFLAQFKDPLIYVLLAAAIVTLLIREFIDTGVIIAILLINAVVGFIQEFKAEKAMRKIREMAELTATVIRGNENKNINASQLVPGDIMVISSGNKIPADARIIEVKDLYIDESPLTGESMPQEKSTKALDSENLMTGDQTNMAFMGTVVTNGKGKAVVTATGSATEIGKISEEIQLASKEKTPLQKRLVDFSKIVGLLSTGLALFVFLVGVVQGREITEMLLFSISLAVSVIPEGLPIAITIAMAIGMKRMADRNAIVRKLIAVETLGSCDYICSDKTGTITQNKMNVKQAYANHKIYHFTGDGYDPHGEITVNGAKVTDDKDLHDLLLTGLLCNESELYREGPDWKINGDPTEGALIVSAQKFGLNTDTDNDEHEYVDEIPFSSERRYMAVLYRSDNKHTLHVKGAPEKILEFSGQKDDPELKKINNDMTGSAFRVLGFAKKELSDIENIDLEKEATSGLTFLGYQGIIDPARQSAIEAIKATEASGIRTVMVTGDHKRTAEAIAKKIGILQSDDITIEGSELEMKGESFLYDNVEKIRVYARVSPEHKLKIVGALQNRGHIVAVTGDGINDAPALKKANIGVSMGLTGTDVAKEASDMTLKDDNFATIFQATKEAKVIFDNIRKVVFFLLGPSLGQAAIIIISLFSGLPLPFLATQVLWVNLVTNGLQDIALAYEPAEPDIGQRKPRNPKESLVNSFILKRLILVGITMTAGTMFIFLLKLSEGRSIEYARTAAFNTIVFFQLFHVFNARSFDRSIFNISMTSNPFLFFSLIISPIAQLAVLYYPPLQRIFQTASLDAATWIQTIVVTLTIIIVMEIDKKMRLKFK